MTLSARPRFAALLVSVCLALLAAAGVCPGSAACGRAPIAANTARLTETRNAAKRGPASSVMARLQSEPGAPFQSRGWAAR